MRLVIPPRCVDEGAEHFGMIVLLDQAFGVPLHPEHELAVDGLDGLYGPVAGPGFLIPGDVRA